MAGCLPLSSGFPPWLQAARHGKGHFLLMTFKEVFDNISADASALREAYNDAIYFKDEGLRAFKLGVLSLEERAQVGCVGS